MCKCVEEIPRTGAVLPKHTNLLHVCHSEELGEYMESKGAVSPGILTLTTSLSKPFTRLERYPALLKELDRHMQVNFHYSVAKSFKNDNNDIIQLFRVGNF